MYGTWLYMYHNCRPTPRMTLPRLIPYIESTSMPILSIADRITPGEATRLCALIAEEMAAHYKDCKWCQMLAEQDLACIDGLHLRDALEHWNRYTLIEVDRKVR
jgi:hypothetical protein